MRTRGRAVPGRLSHAVESRRAPTDPARERLLSLPRESEFAFTTLRGSHYRPSSRSHHWNRVRCSAGLGNVDLYTSTRHYFGWYAWNVLELDARDIALHFGHEDGGELVRKLYGHPDARLAPRARARHRPPGTARARPARRGERLVREDDEAVVLPLASSRASSGRWLR